ncbi:unnamed protein product [Natator depressus]
MHGLRGRGCTQGDPSPAHSCMSSCPGFSETRLFARLSEELTIQGDRKYQRGDLKGDLLSVTSLQNHSEKCKYMTFRASLIKILNPGQSFSKYSILSPKTQILAVK